MLPPTLHTLVPIQHPVSHTIDLYMFFFECSLFDVGNIELYAPDRAASRLEEVLGKQDARHLAYRSPR